MTYSVLAPRPSRSAWLLLFPCPLFGRPRRFVGGPGAHAKRNRACPSDKRADARACECGRAVAQ